MPLSLRTTARMRGQACGNEAGCPRSSASKLGENPYLICRAMVCRVTPHALLVELTDTPRAKPAGSPVGIGSSFSWPETPRLRRDAACLTALSECRAAWCTHAFREILRPQGLAFDSSFRVKAGGAYVFFVASIPAVSLVASACFLDYPCGLMRGMELCFATAAAFAGLRSGVFQIT